MSEKITPTKRAMLQLMSALLGNVSGDKDCADLYKSLKDGGLIRDTELVSDTVMFNLERIHNSHIELNDTMSDIKSLLKSAGQLYDSASEKVLGNADHIATNGVDIERFMVKIADYYVDMLSAAKAMFKCVQSNLDIMAVLNHTVVVALDMPSIVWDASTDADDGITFVLGSSEYTKSLAMKMLSKAGE